MKGFRGHRPRATRRRTEATRAGASARSWSRPTTSCGASSSRCSSPRSSRPSSKSTASTRLILPGVRARRRRPPPRDEKQVRRAVRHRLLRAARGPRRNLGRRQVARPHQTADDRARQCPGNPEKPRGFRTLEARISVSFGPIRLLLGPLIISARVLEIWTQKSLASTRTKSC